MIYFFALIGVAALAAVSFVLYQQHYTDKELKRMKTASPVSSALPIHLSTINELGTPSVMAGFEAEHRNAVVNKTTGEVQAEILVTDDQPAIRMLIAELFSSAGAVVHQAENGCMALELFENHPIDCVLLDLKMPDMSGIDVLKGIRKRSQDVPVILITAYAEPEIIEEAYRLGISKLMSKPFDINELRAVVLEILQLRS
ncbi:CheY-like chemotaxis protein [Paenibacillus castaneae]|uniref:response regulator n=1 Tax=Paenibacillus castaneae TaxID=474957 RepID=UPI001FB95D37|nr:response regulator [Paenibacillus castaneae]NIK76691.1 CheY-like chemotaxis protein [Paenibacillus castaneae]